MKVKRYNPEREGVSVRAGTMATFFNRLVDAHNKVVDRLAALEKGDETPPCDCDEKVRQAKIEVLEDVIGWLHDEYVWQIPAKPDNIVSDIEVAIGALIAALKAEEDK